MSKLVVFSLLGGDLNQGFPIVTAQLWHNNQFLLVKLTGSLPAVPELNKIYRRWQLLYEGIHQRLGSNQRIKVHSQDITNISVNDFDEVCQQLQAHINNWLKFEPFQNIERQLRTLLSRDDEIRVVIETNIVLLHRLPWHLWDFFDDYPKAELALSNHEYASPQVLPKSPTGKVKILAILGNSVGINIDQDGALLQGLIDAQTTFLVEPTRKEVDEHLWNQDWDILFFAGHSVSLADGEIGEIYINKTESLTIPQFKNSLKAAISRGLRLAIFNSCDGIGLEQNLADLNIPQMIAMRESVPDLIAQEFLKNFLIAFAGGKPLYLAVREARERLQGWENEFYCASWLPVICQNPTTVPATWQELRDN
ncbi:MAG: CHAT domain-containing protein, partial [Tolypothrix sp. T3-bin4]|nr:CHAT domain-containing protein [Tolypothrix sp. T3-bin4]